MYISAATRTTTRLSDTPRRVIIFSAEKSCEQGMTNLCCCTNVNKYNIAFYLINNISLY
jgi:hypothetical protein